MTEKRKLYEKFTGDAASIENITLSIEQVEKNRRDKLDPDVKKVTDEMAAEIQSFLPLTLRIRDIQMLDYAVERMMRGKYEA